MKHTFIAAFLFISSIISLMTYSLVVLTKDLFFLEIGILLTICTFLVFAEFKSWKNDPFRK